LVVREPKSGKEQEHVFIPHKVADRLGEYVRQKLGQNLEDMLRGIFAIPGGGYQSPVIHQQQIGYRQSYDHPQ